MTDPTSDTWVQRTSVEYTQGFNNLLPTGPAWPRDPTSVMQMVISGLAEIWGDPVETLAASLLTQESDPRSAIVLLSDWERAWGLPDACLAEPLTIEARHTTLLQRMTLLGAQDRQFFTNIAASIGYTISTIREWSPFMCGVSQIGDTRNLDPYGFYRWEIGSPDMRFYWSVNVTALSLSYFRTSSGQCGVDPMLRIGIATDLECILRRFAPAHTVVIFNYTPLIAPPPALLPLSSRMVLEGDSITAGSVSVQWSEYAIAYTGGRLYLPQGWNQAVGGETAAQMAAEVAATMVPKPKLVTLLTGTNDLSGTTDTVATIYGNILACVEGYLASGAEYVVVSRVLPRNDAAWLALGSQPGRETDRQTLNGMIANLPNDPTLVTGGYSGRVKIATDIETTFNPTTDTVDGLHPNWLGAIMLGKAFADGINECVVQTSTFTDGYLNADNLLLASRNPALTGTTGVMSGTQKPTGQVATGWNVTENGGMTVVASKSTLNGAEAQRIVVSGANATANRVVNFSAVAAYSGAIGDLVEAAIDFTIADGYEHLRALVIACDTGYSPNSGAVYVNMDGAGALSGTLRTAVYAPLAAVDVSTTLQAYMSFDAGAVAADITWGRPYMRKVPAGQ
jgi:uncharacterized protein YmfQ (DUF2313 family)/lysophospholipase L1-like esterase